MMQSASSDVDCIIDCLWEPFHTRVSKAPMMALNSRAG
jgi:hypothetical protein